MNESEKPTDSERDRACHPRLVLACSISERSTILGAMLTAKESIIERLGLGADDVEVSGRVRLRIAGKIIDQDYSFEGLKVSQETTGTENLTFIPGKSGGSTGGGAETGSPPAATEPEITNISEVSES